MKMLLKFIEGYGFLNGIFIGIVAAFFIENFWMVLLTAWFALINFSVAGFCWFIRQYGDFGDECDAE